MQTKNKRDPIARNRKRAGRACQLALARYRSETLPFRQKVTAPLPKEEPLVVAPAIAPVEAAPAAVIEKEPEVKKETPQYRFNRKEWVIAGVLIVIFAALSALGGLVGYDPSKVITISEYGFALGLLASTAVTAILVIAAFLLAVFAVRPAGRKPVFKKTLHVVAWIFFTICGVAAHMVLATLLIQYAKLPGELGNALSMIAVLLYEYLIVKLYAYDALEAKFLGWELFRFALVGAVAAICDFLCTSATRGALNATGLVDVNHGATIITALAVTVGFAVSVIVNYVLSVYMVYKSSTKSTAGRWWGVILFILLSAVGLGIGIGIEMWLYDYVGLSYIIVFIIRTLVVLVWNYISRKLILFR